jgi:hypothetical protein
MLFIALAFAWAPITWHCNLEVLPVLNFLACCEHDEAGGPHQDNDCQQDGCATVESGDYRTQDYDPLFVAPDFMPVAMAAVLELSFLPDEVSVGIFTTAPPEQHHIWQFAFRTALPVRAPSSAS